jgi:hypothetical protein
MHSLIDHHPFHRLARWAVLTALAGSVPIAQAQLATSTPLPALAGAENKSTQQSRLLQYHSVFAQYQGLTEQPVNPWVETNATVGKIGGWRVYAKEAGQPDSSENAEKTPMPNPKYGAHEGHGGKP